MAITIRGSVAKSFANNGGDVTVNLSGMSLQQNDVVIACVAAPRTVTAGTPAMVSSGWTEVITPFVGSVGQQASMGVWYKVMGATPDGSVTMSGDTHADTDTTGIAIGLTGVNTTTVLDQTPVITAESSSATPDPDAIVTQTNGAWVICFSYKSTLTDSPTGTPSGYTNTYDQAGSDTIDHNHAIATKEVATAGSENPGNWTYADSSYWRAITIAVKPASTPSTSPSTSPSSSPSTSVSSSPSTSVSSSPSTSPSTSISSSPSTSISNSPSSSISDSVSDSPSSSPSPSDSPSSSLSSSPSTSPSSSPSTSASSSPSTSPSPPQTEWWNPSSLTINAGNIESGTLADVYLESDDTNLVLDELAATPGFDYEFTFGEYDSVPTSNVDLTIVGYYDGASGHQPLIRQWNYTSTTWTNVPGGVLSDETAEQTYDFPLFDNANYISGGQIKVQIYHAQPGNAAHNINLNRFYLHAGDASSSPSTSPSTSVSSSPSTSPSSSPSTSVSDSPSSSPSPSDSPSTSVSSSPSTSISDSPSSSISDSVSDSPSSSPSPSDSPSSSPSAGNSASSSPSSSASNSPSDSVSDSISSSPSDSVSDSVSESPSTSVSSSPSTSPSTSPSGGAYGGILKRWNGSTWVKSKLEVKT